MSDATFERKRSCSTHAPSSDDFASLETGIICNSLKGRKTSCLFCGSLVGDFKILSLVFFMPFAFLSAKEQHLAQGAGR